MKSLIFSLVLIIGNLALALITDGHVHTTLDNKTNPTQIVVTTDKGFHLNTEAPAGIFFDNQRALFQPSTKTEEKFIFNAPGKVKKAQASVFVCDDKKTVCEKQVLNIQLREDGKKNQAQIENATMMNESGTTAPAVISGRPRLLIFTAPWCPACIRMESETYNQKAFQSAAKNVQVEKHNIDLPENYALSEQYQIKAIPTLILLNEKGEQIGRWLDYTKSEILAKEISSALKNKDNTLQAIEIKANQKDQNAIHDLAVSASKNYNCEEAIKWWSAYEGFESTNVRVAIQVECADMKAQEENKDAEYISKLESGILLTTSKYDQMRWTLNWIEKKKYLKQMTPEMKAKAIAIANQLQEILKSKNNIQDFFKDTSIERPTDFEKEEILALQRKAYNLADQLDHQKKTESTLFNLLQSRKFSVDKPGQMLNAMGYYSEIERKDKLEEFYKKLIAKYPNTYVYYNKLSNFYLKNKNNVEALKYADMALQKAEGNEPQLRFQKAKILKEMDKKTEASAELDAIMNRKEIQHPKYKKLSTQANELKEQLKTSK